MTIPTRISRINTVPSNVGAQISATTRMMSANIQPDICSPNNVMIAIITNPSDCSWAALTVVGRARAQRFFNGVNLETATCGSRGSPSQLPARLAVGLSLGSDPGCGYPLPCAPSSMEIEEFGSPAPAFRKESRLRLLLCRLIYTIHQSHRLKRNQITIRQMVCNQADKSMVKKIAVTIRRSYGGLYQGKKNRARQSGGDRRARGIFEFGTTVGFCSYPERTCAGSEPKSCGQSKNNSN